MFKNFRTQIQVFWSLLRLDLMFITNGLLDKFINTSISCSMAMFVAKYVFVKLGIKSNFAAIQASSQIVSIIGWSVYSHITVFVMDWTSYRHINYLSTLPISAELLLIEYTIRNAVTLFIYGLLSVFIIFLLSYDVIMWFNINFFLLILILMIISLFYAFFGLLLASFLRDLSKFNNLIVRIMLPLWILGGNQFSFKTAYDISPYFAYLTSLSPYTYANEAMRYCLISNTQYMPIWISLGTLVFMTFVVAIFAIYRVKNRLNLI